MPRVTVVTAVALLAAAAVVVLASQSRADIDPKTLYKLDTSGSTTQMKVGGSGKLVVAVVPVGGAHVKQETPFRGTVSATGPITLSATKLDKASTYANDGATVEVPFQAASAGSSQISADLSFFVCTAEACMKTNEKVQVPVTVQP